MAHGTVQKDLLRKLRTVEKKKKNHRMFHQKQKHKLAKCVKSWIRNLSPIKYLTFRTDAFYIRSVSVSAMVLGPAPLRRQKTSAIQIQLSQPLPHVDHVVSKAKRFLGMITSGSEMVA